MSIMEMLLVVCPLVFFASLVDAIAGGGGLISLPAYLFTGMPAHLAIGSNKLSACCGTVFSAARFLKSGSVNLRIALNAAAAALLGAAAGAGLALVLSDHLLRVAILVLLPVAAVFVLTNNRGASDSDTFSALSDRRALLLAWAIGLGLGVYDGFFGPGMGTFLILSFNIIMGFDFRSACGNAKIVNLASNFASLVVFAAAGEILYAVAVPAAACAIAGHWLGAGLAIRRGARFIKPVLVAVLALLFVKIAADMLLLSGWL